MSGLELSSLAALELGEHRATGQRHDGERLGHQRLVVGFRDDDPRRWTLRGDIRGGLRAGACVDCHHEVYLDPGGISAIRDRDAKVACMFCQEEFRDRERIHQSGMVTQL